MTAAATVDGAAFTAWVLNGSTVSTNPTFTTTISANTMCWVVYRRPAPTVSSVLPRSGPIAGGTRITVTGSAFQNGAVVLVGGVAATDVVVVDGSTIQAVTAAATVGAAEVAVQNPDDQSGSLTKGSRTSISRATSRSRSLRTRRPDPPA